MAGRVSEIVQPTNCNELQMAFNAQFSGRLGQLEM
jgi:hypothetical protein